MNVLYSFPHRLGVAGIGNTAMQQVLGLSRLGVRVILACGSCEVVLPSTVEVIETMKIAGMRIPYRLLGHGRAYTRHDRVASQLLRHRRGSIEAVHAWPGAARKLLATAAQVGVKSFLERPNTHTAFAFDEVEREHQLVGVPLPPGNTHHRDLNRLGIEEEEYRLAHRILCPSDFVMRTFCDRGFDPKRLYRHRYGCDLSQFPAGRQAEDQHRPLSACFVGRCEPRKGLHYALQAWHESGAATSGGKFTICGSFMPGYAEHLAKLLNHESVVQAGFSTNVGSFMREADLFVLPAIEEGSALVTYEARASGCVLLVSDASGADVVDGTDALVHRVRDVRQLTNHMSTLVESRQRLEQLRSASLARREEMSWDIGAKFLVAAYSAPGV